MKRTFLISLIFVFINPLALSADFLESQPVGPGVTYHHEYREAGPFHYYVMEIDLTNPYNRLETVKANDRLEGNERTSSMAAREDHAGHRISGAINGDFYAAGGVPVGAQVRNGELLKRPYPRSVFAVSPEKNPFIEIVSFDGTLITSNQNSTPVHGINEVRETNEMILFNRYYGNSTGTNRWGTEVTAEYLTDSPIVNDTFRVIVTGIDSAMTENSGDNSIPQDGLVISGHGTSQTYLNSHVATGDTLNLMLALPPIESAVSQLIGGTPRIIRNGQVFVEWQNEGTGESFAADRHPRTAVGFNADSTKLYLFAVDGRQAGFSVGNSLYELANYMLEWDVHEGVNLDGGGSTTMVVRNSVVNSPSDGTERAVANALLVVNTAPVGPLASIEVNPDELYLLADGSHNFSATGYDEYYHTLSLNPDSLAWTCDPAIGTIDSAGQFVAGNQQDSGYVIAEYNGIRDSARVYITNVASITLTPNPIVLEVDQQQQISAEALDSYGNAVSIHPSDFEWAVSGDFGIVSQEGLFTATSEGTGYITATYNAAVGSTDVSVGTSSSVILDPFDSVENWTLTGLRVDLANCNFITTNDPVYGGESAAQLDYALTTGGTSVLYMERDLQISGSPESIGIHVYGDGKNHWLRGELADADNEKFLMNFTEADPGIDWTDSWEFLEVAVEDVTPSWANPSATIDFPVTLTRIYLAETDEENKNSGTIYLDELQATFTITGLPEQGENLVSGFELAQNYPNPFNPSTTIRFHVLESSEISLQVFDLRGRLVTTLINEPVQTGWYTHQWSGTNSAGEMVSSGVYFYRLETDSRSEMKKMVLMK